jgi:hypothetical protein
MKNLKTTALILIIIICVAFLPQSITVQAFDANSPIDSVKGVWQGIVDGAPSEGAFFYRMEFSDNGIVMVTKQYGGHNIREQKSWSMLGNSIEIQNLSKANITDFDGVILTIIDDKTIAYNNGSYIGTISKHNNTLALIHWFMILVVLIALNELFRKSKWAGLIFYCVLPILLLPVWSSYGVTYWFKWVKLFSVVVASIWFIFIRFSKLGKYDFAKLVAALFLAGNIGEAVIQDFSMGYLPNILNAIAGILSILTLFYGWRGIHADSSREKDMLWPKMTIFWIIAYDIWNWVFVYLNFPGSASAQFMVLLSCTLPSLFIKKGTWLQARAFTLAAWFMYYFTFPRFTESLELLVPRNDSLMLIVALASIISNSVYAIIYVKMLSKKKGATLTV